MHDILQLATEALAVNDAELMEALCDQAAVMNVADVELEQFSAALLAFRRQVSGARRNVVLRERLLELRTGEGMQWAR